MRTITASLVLAGLLVSAQAYAKETPRPKQTATVSNASLTELEAIWNMRAALNVAALQCQHDPMLALPARYNTFIRLHEAELKQVYDTLVRKRGGQAKFDRINTQVYNKYATVKEKDLFCTTAADVSVIAMNAASYGLSSVASTVYRSLSRLIGGAEVASVSPAAGH